MSERPKETPIWHKVFGVVETLALAACATGERIGLVTPLPEGTATNPTETLTTPRATLLAQPRTPVVTTIPEKTPFACGGFSALEAIGKPYDYTVGGLANIASDCNAMGESSGTIKVFSFEPDTKLPANIDVRRAQEANLSLTAYGLDFQAFVIEEPWADRQGQEYPNGLIMVIPDGFGIASGFGAAVPPGGYFLVTIDKATGPLNRYQLFKIVPELPIGP